MNSTVDNLVERLYSSNDPLCYEAGQLISKNELDIARLRQDNEELAFACRMMMDSLMEIVDLSRERDRGVKKTQEVYIAELGLRLKECGSVAADTLKLDSVTRAYNGYIY